MRDVVFVVGNGLPIDLRSTYPSLPNTSQPLSISVIPDHHCWDGCMANLDLEVYYPHLMEVLKNFGSKNASTKHFDIISNIIKSSNYDERFNTKYAEDNAAQYFLITGNQDTWWTGSTKKRLALSQLRLYMIYVFSYFDKITPDDCLKEWRWAKWMIKNSTRISQVVSFNYDIIVERVLNMLSITDYVLTERDVKTGVNLLMFSKPHGSINHVMKDVIDTGQVFWNMPAPNGIFEFCQGDVSIINRNFLYDSRQFSDMVLPTEAPGARRKMRHIDHGYRRLCRVGQNTSICVIAGLSYSMPDRPEIDEILDLVPRAKFLICDPRPSSELLEKLNSRGKHYTLLYNDLPEI